MQPVVIMNSFINSLREHIARMRSDRFLLAWNLSLLVTMFLPLIVFGVTRVGMSQGEENKNEDNYHSWWQFWKGNNNNEDQHRQGEDDGSPWWYFWGNDRGMEEGGGRGVLAFIYVWTVLSLLALGYFGNRYIIQGNYIPLGWMNLSFIHYAFIVMVLVSGLGAIQNEGREIEETGWYGQLSVLVFLTCLLALVKCLVFQVLLYRKSRSGKVVESHHEEHMQQHKSFELLDDSLV